MTGCEACGTVRLTTAERLEALRLVGGGAIGLERALQAVLRIERERRALAAELAVVQRPPVEPRPTA